MYELRLHFSIYVYRYKKWCLELIINIYEKKEKDKIKKIICFEEKLTFPLIFCSKVLATHRQNQSCQWIFLVMN